MSLKEVGAGSYTFEGATQWYADEKKAQEALDRLLNATTSSGSIQADESADVSIEKGTSDMTPEEFAKLQEETVAQWEAEAQAKRDAANLQLITDLRNQVAGMSGDVVETSDEIQLIREQLALEQAKVDQLTEINEQMTQQSVDSSGQLVSTIEDLEQSIADMERAAATSAETEKIINAMDSKGDPMMLIGGAVAIGVVILFLVVIAGVLN